MKLEQSNNLHLEKTTTTSMFFFQNSPFVKAFVKNNQFAPRRFKTDGARFDGSPRPMWWEASGRVLDEHRLHRRVRYSYTQIPFYFGIHRWIYMTLTMGSFQIIKK